MSSSLEAGRCRNRSRRSDPRVETRRSAVRGRGEEALSDPSKLAAVDLINSHAAIRWR